MPPAPTITVVPPLRVAQMHVSITGPGADRVERVVDTDAARSAACTVAITSSLVGIDHVGGAEPLRVLAPLGDRIGRR